MSKQWFEVDTAGLGKQAEQHGKGRLVGELVQNALDEAGVTRIDITPAPVPGRPLADLAVEDDSPEGFKDLAHAYTLFAESYKRANPEQRGQYNFGEKLVLAICESASIATTKGTVVFDPDEGRIEKPRQKRERGSAFQGRIRLTREEFPEVCDYLRSLLLPDNVTVTFNGDRLLPRLPLRTFEASLETPVADESGVMRLRVRKTRVGVYEALPGEVPSLYEMGLPVVETGDRWHVSVGQKVLLNRDRDNVRPAYLQAVRVAVLNAAYDLLTTDEEATAPWCKLAGGDPRCSDAAIKHLIRLRFGEKVAAPDPSDTEAMKRFTLQGGTIVVGLSKGEWANVKRAGAAPPAGQICPTARPYSTDPGARPVDLVPEEDWTDAIKNVAAYARFLAEELTGVKLVVSVVRTANNFAACYGGGRLDFNLFRLGHGWFEQGITEDVDELLIHEFGHQYSGDHLSEEYHDAPRPASPPGRTMPDSGDHLSEEYHDALCRLGARLKRLALEKPDVIRSFVGEGSRGRIIDRDTILAATRCLPGPADQGCAVRLLAGAGATVDHQEVWGRPIVARSVVERPVSDSLSDPYPIFSRFFAGSSGSLPLR
jgi:hypothetical protein